MLTAVLAAALWAGAGEADAQPARDYREELRQAQSSQRRKRYRECIAACEKMLAYHTEAWQVKEVTWLKIDCLVSDSQYAQALAALAGLGKAFAADGELQATVGLRTGDVQRTLKRCDDAVATYRKAAAACEKDEPDRAADALLRAADVLCADLAKPADGIALYEQVESRFGPRQPKRGAEALRSIATAHEKQTKDVAKAVAARPDNCEGHRAKGYLYVYWGKPKDAAAEFLRAFKAADMSQVTTAAQELVLVGMKAHTASFRGLGRIFEYVSYGPKGKSGKEKLADPFAGLE